MAIRLIVPDDVAPSGDEQTALTSAGADRAAYLRDFLHLGPRALIATSDLERFVLMVGDKALPVVVNDGREEDCYLLSPYAHYVKYMLLELRKITGSRSRVLRTGVALLGHASLPLGFNRCVSVNNWLFTTNPRLQLTPDELHQITSLLVTRYPGTAIVIRTVDAREPATQRMFTEAGYRLVVNRPVHGWDPASLKASHRRNVRTDIKLLSDPRFSVIPSAELAPGEETSLHRLYSALYLEKHAAYNCRFTPRFFRSVHDAGLMQFTIVREREQGRIMAFSSYLEDGDRTVLALVGYDTAMDKGRFPLYRMAIAAGLQLGFERRRPIFLSTGAAAFKLQRGSREWMEHEAIYDRHLPAHRRIPWAVFKTTLEVGTNGLATNEM